MSVSRIALLSARCRRSRIHPEPAGSGGECSGIVAVWRRPANPRDRPRTAVSGREAAAPAPIWRRRPKLIAAIALGVVLFLAASALLARFLQVENVERDADLALIQAEARGDVAGMLAHLSGCRERAACVAAVRANAVNPRLRRAGAVKILSLKSSTSYSPTGASGKTRLAWTVVGKLPVVQCIEVRRTGDFVSGMKVTLLSLSAPIPNEADC